MLQLSTDMVGGGWLGFGFKIIYLIYSKTTSQTNICIDLKKESRRERRGED